MNNAYTLLSEPIRKYIRDKHWEQLRAIQTAAIEKILTTDNNYILISRTASGKTEAAFLPILSKIDFYETGVQVLYISPLIALINDQFNRVEELCKNLDINVTKWHGEASRSLKEHLIQHPEGIVLITPESIEAMFVNKSYQVRHLFSNLKYVVIDEIHSFIGTDRGKQLQSLLSRLQDINNNSFSIIGLSATVSEENKFMEVKEYTGNAEKTKILIDRSHKNIQVDFRYFEGETENLPLDLLKDLYLETRGNKALIFPNSRGRAEEVAVKLKKIAQKVNGHINYFSHHSSVDREVREYIEFFAKNNTRQNFSIACTSTLELGIDIGAVDEVIQIDATFSISSLIQRIGRSGRKDDESSNLILYATNQWSLLQSIACWELYKAGFIEPTYKNDRPYDILLHQALSIVKGYPGKTVTELTKLLKENFAFNKIDQAEIIEIIHYMIETELIEQLQQELILGLEGEKIVNSRDFYSVFTKEPYFKVINSGNVIGEIPFSTELSTIENIFLAARIWNIQHIDMKAMKIDVVPAKDGNNPVYHGAGGNIHPKIKEKMMEILYSESDFEYLNQTCKGQIKEMRNDFSYFKIQNLEYERPLLIGDLHILLYTFTGSRINHTIKFLLDLVGITSSLDDRKSEFYMEISKSLFLEKWKEISSPLADIDKYLSKLLKSKPFLLNFSKWAQHLPEKYQVLILKERYFDIDGTIALLSKMVLVENG